MKIARTLWISWTLGLGTAALAVACSSSKSNGAAPDASAPDASQDSAIVPTDGGAPDAAKDSATTADASDASMDAGSDAVPPPTATPVLLGNNLELWGVTSDNYAIYSDENQGVLYALSIGSTTPKKIATGLLAADAGDQGPDASAPGHFVTVTNKVVAFWSDIDGMGSGAMSLWTSTMASPVMISTRTLAGAALATVDSAHVSYVDNFDGNTGVGDFSEITPEGTNKLVFQTGVDINGGCYTSEDVAGSSYFLLNHCEAIATDGGAPEAGADASPDAATGPTYLSEFSVATGARVDLLTTTATNTSANFAVNPAGTQVVVSYDPGLEVFTLGPSPTPGTLIDKNGGSPIVITPDGASVVYTSIAAAGMWRSPLAAPSPTSLQPAFTGIYAMSPDGKEILGNEMSNPSCGLTDVYLASSSTASAATTVLAKVAAIVAQGDSFTGDSTHAMYVDQSGSYPQLGIVPVAGGPTSFINDIPDTIRAAGPSSAVIVFTLGFNFNQLSNGAGTGDLYMVDTSKPAQPTLIAYQVNADFYLSAPKDKVVFVWNDLRSGPKSGLYVVPVL